MLNKAKEINIFLSLVFYTFLDGILPMVHLQIISFVNGHMINRETIENAWNSALDKYRLSMSLFSQGVKTLMPTDRIEKKFEELELFIDSCHSMKPKILNTIWELSLYFNEINLYIFQRNLWLNSPNGLVSFIGDEDVATLSSWEQEASDEMPMNFNFNFKINDDVTIVQLRAMMMRATSNLYFSVRDFIDRAYYQTDFIDDDERERLINANDSFMRSVSINIVAISDILFKYIRDTYNPNDENSIFVYTSGIAMTASRKGHQPLFIYRPISSTRE